MTASSLDQFKDLHFHDFTFVRYPIVKLAKYVIEQKGTYGAVFNASNEVAVNAFIEKKISYPQIARIVRSVLDRGWNTYLDSFETVLTADNKARKLAMELL